MASLLSKVTVTTGYLMTLSMAASEQHLSKRVRQTLAGADKSEKISYIGGNSVNYHEDSATDPNNMNYNEDFAYPEFLRKVRGAYDMPIYPTTQTLNTDFGLSYGWVADIFGSFSAPAYWVEKLDKNWLVWNPSVFFEGGATGELTFKTPLVNMIVKLHLVGFKIAPLDLSMSFDLDGQGTRC